MGLSEREDLNSSEGMAGTAQSHRKSLLLTRVTPGLALLILLAIAVLRIWIVEMAIVEGDSMLNTFHDGDRVLISKVLQVTRFDVVVVNDPEIGGVDIKRVVGVPGDWVSMVPYVEKQGNTEHIYGCQLYINSIPYTEPYAASLLPVSYAPRKLKDHEYFLLGDNRDVSIDSRKYGPIDGKRIRGVAIAIVAPVSRIRGLTRGGEAAPDMTAIEQR
jgi:signal peptidase I